jgi:hypothetical protein
MVLIPKPDIAFFVFFATAHLLPLVGALLRGAPSSPLSLELISETPHVLPEKFDSELKISIQNVVLES